MTIKDRQNEIKIDSIFKHRIIFVMIGLIPLLIFGYLLFNDIIISDKIAVLLFLPYFILFVYPMKKIGILDYYQMSTEERKQDCFTRKFVIFVHSVMLVSYFYFMTLNTNHREAQEWNNIIQNHPTLIHRTCGCRKKGNDKPFSDYKIITIDGNRFIESKNGRYQLDEIEIYKVIK